LKEVFLMILFHPPAKIFSAHSLKEENFTKLGKSSVVTAIKATFQAII